MVLDLKNGVFDLGGYPLTKDTTIDDIPEIEKYNVEVAESKRHPGEVFFVDSKQYISFGGVSMRTDVVLGKEDKAPTIRMYPIPDPNSKGGKDAVESCMWALEQSKKWLKAALFDVEPSEESDHHIYYAFSWGGIGAFCHEERVYGMTGGHIKVKFNA